MISQEFEDYEWSPYETTCSKNDQGLGDSRSSTIKILIQFATLRDEGSTGRWIQYESIKIESLDC